MKKTLPISVLCFACAFLFIFIALFVAFSPNVASASETYLATDSEYSVFSQEDFEAFAKFNKSSSSTYNGKKISLYTDVDMTGIEFSIATFYGIFEGNGHTLYNLSAPIFGAIMKPVAGNGGMVSDLNIVANNAVRSGFADVVGEGAVVDNVNVFGTIVPGSYILSGMNSGYVWGGLTVANRGTLKNCGVYAEYAPGNINGASALKIGGATVFNYYYGNPGKIESVVVSGNIAASRTIGDASVFGGIAAVNFNTEGSVSGTIEDSVFASDARLSGFGGVYAISDAGNISSCAAYVNTSTSSFLFCKADCSTVGDGYFALNGSGGIKHSYINESAREEGTASATKAKLSEKFDKTGDYPVPTALTGGNISSVADLFNLRITALNAGDYKFGSDIDLRGIGQVKAMGFTYAGGTAEGNGYLILNGGSEKALADELNVKGNNIGFINSENTMFGKDDTGGYSAENGDYGAEEAETPVVAGTLEESGEKTDPYIIETAEDLKALDGKSGIALLKNDIVLNRSSDGKKNMLGLENLAVTLRGGGHAVIGLFEPLAKNLTGKAENIILVAFGSAAVADNNSGTIERVSVYGKTESGIVGKNSEEGRIVGCKTYGEFTSHAFATTNDGTISECENYGKTQSPFTPSESGRTENCANYGEQTEDSDGAGIYSSLNFVSSKVYDGAVYAPATLSSKDLREFSFDFVGKWGYPVGTDVPELRKSGGKYKRSAEEFFRDFLETSWQYSPKKTYAKSYVEQYILDDASLTDMASDTTYEWKYNGGEMTETEVKNAGTYEITADFVGNDDFLALKKTFTVTVKKAPAPAIVFTGGFEDLTFDYNGEVKFVTPEYNSADFSEFSPKWTIMKDAAEASVLEAGTYTQTLLLTATNYENAMARRTITVNKAKLRVRVGNAETAYLQEANVSGAGYTVFDEDVFERDRDGVTLKNAAYSTDYETGDDVGDYYIDFTAEADNYYIETAERGVLTVNPIDFTEDMKSGISFYGATAELNGAATEEYSAETIALTATAPEDVGIRYENNANVNCNEEGYEVKAIFSKKNYNDYILTTVLHITKATLTLETPSYELPYLSPFNPTTLREDIKITGLKGRDNASVYADVEFSVEILKDGEVYSGGLNCGDRYTLKVKADGTMQNYEFAISEGTLTITKAPLTAVYQNNVNANEDFADRTGDKSLVYKGTDQTPKITFFAENEAEIEYEITFEPTNNGAKTIVESVIAAGRYTVKATVTPKGRYETNYSVTEYYCKVTVNKAQPAITFKDYVGSREYNGENQAILENFPYEINADAGVPRVVCWVAGIDYAAAEARNAGDYTVFLQYAETDNYLSATSARMTFKVTKKPLTLTFQEEYQYTGSPVRVVNTSFEGAINAEVGAGDLIYSFRNQAGIAIGGNPSSVGEYTFTLSFRSSNAASANYDLGNTVYNLRILPEEIEVEFGEVEFVYGFTGTLSANGATYNVAKPTTSRAVTVTRRIGSRNVTVSLSDYSVGTHQITPSMLGDANVVYTLTGKNSVTVTRASLELKWKYNGNEIQRNVVDNRFVYNCDYQGKTLDGGFAYELVGAGWGDSAGSLGLTKTISGDSNTIYNAGNYTVTVNIPQGSAGERNYSFKENCELYVVVNKAKFTINVSDYSVRRGEMPQLSNITYAPTRYGVGADERKLLTELDGAYISLNLGGYTTSSAVGSTYRLTLNATFTNYEPTINPGTLTVVRSPYRTDYAFSRNEYTFVYTGEPISVTITDLEEGVTVTYENNTLTDVGETRVTAHVHLLTGQTMTVYTTLRIIPAMPVVTAEDREVAYREETYLDDGIISGTATFRGANVEGRFTLTGDKLVRRGTYQYSYSFVPDSRNFDTYNGRFTVTSASLDASCLVFDPIERVTAFDGENMTISSTVVLTLNAPLKGAELRLDGYKVDSVALDKSMNARISIYLNGREEYFIALAVTLEEEEEPAKTIGQDSFVLKGLRIDGNTIYVSEGGGRLALEENLKESYNLMVNGIALSELVLNGDEGNVMIVVVMKYGNTEVFVKTFNVVSETSLVAGDEGKPSYKLYIIIGAAVLGVGAVIAVVLIIWKKKNG